MAVAVMQETTDAAQRAPARAPEERLRAYIRIFLHRLLGEGRDVWLHRLINRELVDPTPAVDALDVIVEQALRPRVDYLSGLVAQMTDCQPDDWRVLECVICIQGMCVLALPNPILDRLRPKSTPWAGEIKRLADHIAEFSLAGIRAVGHEQDVRTEGRRTGARAGGRQPAIRGAGGRSPGVRAAGR